MRQRMLQLAILAALHSILLRFNGVAALAAEGSALSQDQNARGRHNIEHHAGELIHLSRGLQQAPNTYSYGEFDGYKDWGGMCQQAKQIPQSPINIPSTKIKEALANPTRELAFNYANLTGVTAANTGHGVQVNMPEGNFLTVGAKNWKLLHFHFHTPSENSFGGRMATMDIHLVHSNAAGEMAVVAVPLNAQELLAAQRPYNLALAQGLEMVPGTIMRESEPFRLDATTFSSLLAPTGALPLGATSGSGSVPAVWFTGSLTTPPCTAGVQWYVLMMSSPVGPGQVLSFQRLLGNGTTLSQNRRPIQPRLNRDISVTMVPSVSLSPAPGPTTTTAPASAPSKVPEPVVAPAAAPVQAPVKVSPPQQTGLGGKGGLGGLGGRGGGGQGGLGGLGGQGGSGAVNGADGANGANGANGQSFG